MTKKIGDKKVGTVQGTKQSSGVDGPDSIQNVSGIKATSSVGSIKGIGAGGKRKTTLVISPEEREKIFKMIDEEADKMFGSSATPADKREMVKNAVKMAVDTGLVGDDE
jgi:hypothetical protein